eukprot:SM000015S01200  [mRNA]  locus=s15:556823:559773:+ [translate_table: standard]
MFYFFFESRGDKETDPLVLWMTGGPGCSSELAVFYENGPWNINEHNLSLSWNDYGWDTVSNMIYVDQPINTGFSYSHDPRDMRHDEKGVSEDMYDFLQVFLEAHPDYADRDLFITGESYGGHYVPALGGKIHAANKAKLGKHIYLKGMGIGNGLTVAKIQWGALPDYAFQNNLISEAEYVSIRRRMPACQVALKYCGSSGTISCIAAFVLCNNVFASILQAAGNINYYDIRENCTVPPLCYDFSPLDRYLDQPGVREALGVGSRRFQSCSTFVYKAMIMDFMRDLEKGIPEMLEDGIKLLVYAGENDLICNWLGNSRWVAAIEWSGHDEYQKAAWLPFKVDGEEAGIGTGTGPLFFLKLHNAGHLVPMDQPKAALEMLKRWIDGQPLTSPAPVSSEAETA